jgi:uncharacterized cupin superfamily protein
MQKKIDVQTAMVVCGSRNPAPYHEPCKNRFRRVLGDAAGLTQFGANLMRLPAGTWSSQRHWHSAEDEFIYMVEGELVLETDSGEETIKAGDCVGFKAGNPDGHHLQNRSARDALYLEIGSRRPDEDEVTYPDIDLKTTKGREGYAHVNGELYPDAKPRNPATGQ